MNTQTIVWGLRLNETLPRYIEEFDLHSICDQSENIFVFLDKWSTKPVNIILYKSLTKYSTEANYRSALAFLVIGASAKSEALIIEEQDNKSIPLIFRAARALGIENCLESSVIDDLLVLRLQRPILDKYITEWKVDVTSTLIKKNEIETVKYISDCIVHHKAISLIRVGHCEVRFLGYPNFYGESDILKSCIIQWGSRAPDVFIKKVISDLETSISGADIVGFKKRSSFKTDTLGILENSVPNCLTLIGLLNSEQIHCSPNIHFTLGTDLNFINSLINVPKIVLVSPRLRTFEKLKKISKGVVEWLEIPGEARIDGPTEINRRIENFFEVQEKLQQLSTSGTVVLVGAGVAGKIFCDIAKRGGAVGLDMGSTLDAWGDIDSRGSGFAPELKNALNIN